MSDIHVMTPSPCVLCGKSVQQGEHARRVQWREYGHIKCVQSELYDDYAGTPTIFDALEAMT